MSETEQTQSPSGGEQEARSDSLRKRIRPLFSRRKEGVVLGSAKALIAGGIAGLFSVLACLTMAGVVFVNAPVILYLQGVVLALSGVVIVSVVVGLFGRVSGGLVMVNPSAAVLIGVMVTIVYPDLITLYGGEAARVQILWFSTALTLFIGIFFFGLCLFREERPFIYMQPALLGGIRLIISILLLEAVLQPVIGRSINLSSPDDWAILFSNSLFHLIAAVGGSIFILGRFFRKKTRILSLVAVGVIIGLYFFEYQSISALEGFWNFDSWGSNYRGVFIPETLWQRGAPPGREWDFLINLIPELIVFAFISALLLVVDTVHIGALSRYKFNVHRETGVTGLANVIAGLVGAVPAWYNEGISKASMAMGGHNQIAHFANAGVCALFLLFGFQYLEAIPVLLITIFAFVFACGHIYRYVILGWRQMRLFEYFLMLSALPVMAFTDPFGGLTYMILAGFFMFVMSHVSVDAVRDVFSGRFYHSMTDRSDEAENFLQKYGEGIFVLRLQNTILVGMARDILTLITERLSDNQKPLPRFLILDFSHVENIDPAAIQELKRLLLLSDKDHFMLIFSSLAKSQQKSFEKAGLKEQTMRHLAHKPGRTGAGKASGHKNIRYFSSLDVALTWAEDYFLSLSNVSDGRGLGPITFEDWLGQTLNDANAASKLMKYLEQKDFFEGEYLTREGTDTNDIFFIEDGAVSVYQMDESGGKQVCLRHMRGGSIIGEVGFYMGQLRTATVVADISTRGYSLSRENFVELGREDPELAVLLHGAIISHLMRRLAMSNHMVHFLLQS